MLPTTAPSATPQQPGAATAVWLFPPSEPIIRVEIQGECMSTGLVASSRRLPQSSDIAPLRERASVFLRRHKWTAVLELAVVASLFAAHVFTFSSGVLGLAFVLLMLWLR